MVAFKMSHVVRVKSIQMPMTIRILEYKVQVQAAMVVVNQGGMSIMTC